MVDWSLARQVARFAAGSDSRPDLGVDLGAIAATASGRVREYTGLAPGEGRPEPEVVDRERWADANLGTLEQLLDPVTERLDRRLERAGPLAGALRAGAGAMVAAEVGLVMGLMSQRVLGQFELSLLQPEAPTRLLFVAPNLLRAVEDLAVPRESFLGWVTIHEVTHAHQFGGVPWLRDHLGGLLRRYLSTMELRIEHGSAGALPTMPDLSRLVERFREGGLAALVQTGEQRELLDRVQAAMALIEGHAEHVMDVLAPGLLDDHEGLRAAMDHRRRNRSTPERVLYRLLGLELKLRQYELGKTFCDAVVAEGGPAALGGAWESPAALPTLAELERPELWLARAPAAA